MQQIQLHFHWEEDELHLFSVFVIKNLAAFIEL